jgi:hypothetical protein
MNHEGEESAPGLAAGMNGLARTPGRTPELQPAQTRHAQGALRRALAQCQQYDLWSERAAALLFGIFVRNGSIGSVTHQRIAAEIPPLPSPIDSEDEAREVRNMEIIANRRTEASRPRGADDLRTRKLCIA